MAKITSKTRLQSSAPEDDLDPALENGNLAAIAGLSIPKHDYIGLSYTGSNLTQIVYKSGGSSGTTVATLTLAYDGSNNLISITKS